MATKAEREYTGGYRFLEEPLVRTGIRKHTTGVPHAISDETLSALNYVQRVPWRINRRVYQVMMDAYNSGYELGGLPYNDAQAVPDPKPDEEWARMTVEEKTEWKRTISQIHASNAKLESQRQAFIGKAGVARLLLDEDQIWFPHFLDFRSRFYPMPSDLHPQGDDVAKSLLEFAEGKPLGERGFFWLCVRLANTFGQDKLHLQERFDWCIENSELLFDCADNPLDGHRFWEEAEDPFQALATAFEFSEALLSENREEYVSHLPVNVDGSCNGLQHLSALGRDAVGARSTNVAANEERQDIYLDVASKVIACVEEDAAKGNPLAVEWLGRIGRKTVKRAVMTTPYGVTSRGMTVQLRDDGHTSGMKSQTKSASYLREKIEVAVNETVVSATKIMAWVQDIAAELSRNGIPFKFETPCGNIIQQAYFRMGQTRCPTLYGTLTLWHEDREGVLDDRKQALAAAPNLIHALDASHMVKTINSVVREVPDISLAMIHDSFGCHACDVGQLSKALRETFVEIYRENWLERLYQQMMQLAPEVTIPHWSKYLELGTFDIEECLQSEFFFS